MLKLSHAKTLHFCAFLFKCKWAAAPGTGGGASKASHRHTENFKNFMFKPESDNDGETQDEVTTCRQHFWMISGWIYVANV